MAEYINSYYDIIYFEVTSVDSDTLLLSDRGEPINKMIREAVAANDYDAIKYRRLEPWAKMFSHNFIAEYSLKFDETIAANDLMFSVCAAYNASNIWVDLRPIYCLTARYGSIAHTISNDVCEAKLMVILRLNDFLLHINKFQYRANVFHYAWVFHHISYLKMFYKFRQAFVQTHHCLVFWDFFYYLCFLMKSMFKKKSSLIKVCK